MIFLDYLDTIWEELHRYKERVHRMRKYIKIILVIMLTLALPVRAYADELKTATNSLTITCTPSKVNPGGNVSCTLKMNTDTKQFTSASIKVAISDEIDSISFTKDAGFGNGADYNNGVLAVYAAGLDNTGEFTLGVISVKIKDTAKAGTGSITLSGIKVYHDDVNESGAEDVKTTITIEEKSLEPVKKGLSNIKITGGALTWNFSTDRLDYTADIESTTFSIEATPNNPEETVKYYYSLPSGEEKELNPSNITFDGGEQGIMNIIIKVGDVVYEINAKRKQSEDDPKLDNSLSTLVVDGKTIDLIPGKTDYEVTVRNIDKYEFKATLKDPDNFKFDEMAPGEGIVNGSSFEIKIIPKDTSSGGEAITYIIKVTGSGSGGSSSKPSSNTGNNPQTSGISTFFITLIIIASLVVSLTLYKKNVDTYE